MLGNEFVEVDFPEYSEALRRNRDEKLLKLQDCDEHKELFGNNIDHSVVYIHNSTMPHLNLFRGDTVMVRGRYSRKIVLIVLSNENCRRDCCYVGSKVFENLFLSKGDSVQLVGEPNFRYANRVQILPVGEKIEEGRIFEEFVKPYFLEAYRPVTRGEFFEIKSSKGKKVLFKVVDTDPGSTCIVAPETVIFLEGNPLETIFEEEFVGYDDLDLNLVFREELIRMRTTIDLVTKYPTLLREINMKCPIGMLVSGSNRLELNKILKATITENPSGNVVWNSSEINSHPELIQGEVDTEYVPKIILLKDIDEYDIRASKRLLEELKKLQLRQKKEYSKFVSDLEILEEKNRTVKRDVIGITTNGILFVQKMRRITRNESLSRIGMSDGDFGSTVFLICTFQDRGRVNPEIVRLLDGGIYSYGIKDMDLEERTGYLKNEFIGGNEELTVEMSLGGVVVLNVPKILLM